MRFHWIFTLAAATALACTGSYAAPEGPYYAYKLPFSEPLAINNAGQVVGMDVKNRGYITGPNGKGAKLLGSFGGYTVPNDINDAGVVVGRSGGKAFITDAGGENFREIVMPEEHADADAVAINSAGQVVGVYLTPSLTIASGYDYHGFITEPGGLNARRLDGFNPDFTKLYAINASGQVVGTSSYSGDGVSGSFVTGPNGEGLTRIDAVDGHDVFAEGINDAGQLGGVVYDYGGNVSNPFVMAPGRPMKIKQNLGGEYAIFDAINARGDTVGTSTTASGRQRAYVSTWNGRLLAVDKLVRDLPADVVFTIASDINDRRQIVVMGTNGYIVCPTQECQ